ncbi:MAG: TOBE domain-containing protein, partial [Actinomycetota bacterium]|nr:TOBE domain-containing protein [Actinomycetota bacterium]
AGDAPDPRGGGRDGAVRDPRPGGGAFPGGPRGCHARGADRAGGTPEEVYGRPTSRWVADFLGDAEIVPGTAAAGAVECELGRFPIPKELEGVVDVVVRPESVALGAGPAPGRDRSYEGVVVAREYYGHDQLVEVELSSGRRLRSRSIGFPIWHPGDRVRVWIDGPVNALSASGAEES